MEGRETGRPWQFESLDGGHSWSEPRETEKLGKPPHLLTVIDGRIVVTYGYRMRPTDSAPVSPKMAAIRGTTKRSCAARRWTQSRSGLSGDGGVRRWHSAARILSAASARRKALSDDDALANLKIKVFTLADGHRHWVMLFDFVEHHPDRPAPYVSHEDTTQYALAKDSRFNPAMFPRLWLVYKLLGDRLAYRQRQPPYLLAIQRLYSRADRGNRRIVLSTPC